MTENNRVIERLAPHGTDSVLATLAAFGGFALVFGPSVVGVSLDSVFRRGTLVVGGVLLFAGVIRGAQYGSRAVDEREAQIRYRASWVALMALLAASLSLSVGLSENVVSLAPRTVLHTVLGVTFGAVFAAQWVYRWLM